MKKNFIEMLLQQFYVSFLIHNCDIAVVDLVVAVSNMLEASVVVVDHFRLQKKKQKAKGQRGYR